MLWERRINVFSLRSILYQIVVPAPSDHQPDKTEKVVIFDISDQLVEELKRRARESGNDLKGEVEKIIEDHLDDTT
jgi:hypothetical protein